MKKRLWWIPAAILVAFLVAALGQIRRVLIPFPSYPGDAKLGEMEISEDQVFFDSKRNRLVVVRKPRAGDPSGPRVETIPVDFARRIAPTVSVDVRSGAPDRWLYRYTVGNEGSAVSPIESWRLDIPEPRSPDPFNPLDLDPNSPFVQACLEYLQNVVDDTTLDEPGLVPDFLANPGSPLEESVYQSLGLALELEE